MKHLNAAIVAARVANVAPTLEPPHSDPKEQVYSLIPLVRAATAQNDVGTRL